jgi:hypothetical protein
MDFDDAVRLMKEGNKLRRPQWDKEYYLELVGTTQYFRDNYGVCEITLSMVEATDWEVYDEEDWNLNKHIGYGNEITIDNLRTLKEKIKIDMTKLSVDLGEGNRVLQPINKILDKRFGL